MNKARKHGIAPYDVAVIHGGPGAVGSMAPISRYLSKDRGVLEPLITADSLGGQVEELKTVLQKHATLPTILIGHSYGAWLSLIVAATYHKLISKLILISSGPFHDQHTSHIEDTRLKRLSKNEQREYRTILESMRASSILAKSSNMTRLHELSQKTDLYDPIEITTETEQTFDKFWGIFVNVSKDASEFRSSGKFIEQIKKIRCPIVAIHGDYDPHPAAGVREPLADIVHDFRFILLEKCGHDPWQEKQAREIFFHILKKELTSKH